MNLRPKKLSEIIGNDTNNKLILSMAKSEHNPSTLIFSGPYGCGKTTLARLAVKAFNCKNLSDDICGDCEICRCSFDNNPCYAEYDSSFFGNKEAIQDMYEDLTFVPKGKKRVVVLDEAHLISRQGQAALLKIFEDAPKNIYYILCTTDKEAILPTIVSRSLSLNFTTKSKIEITDNLFEIAGRLNVKLSNEAADLIALRSKGHMRDAHMLFEKYLLLGEEDFLHLEESGYNYLAKYFAQVLWLIKNPKSKYDEIKQHKSTMLEIAERLSHIPVALLKDDYQRLFLDLTKKCFDHEYKSEVIVDKLIQVYDVRSIMMLYKFAVDDFMMSSFESDIRFQAALLSLYQRISLNL